MLFFCHFTKIALFLSRKFINFASVNLSQWINMKEIKTCASCGLQVAVENDNKSAICPRCERPISMQPQDAMPAFYLIDTNKVMAPIPLDEGRNSIGRQSHRSKAKIQIADPSCYISKSHAMITVTHTDGKAMATVQDTNSANGTYINDNRIIGISERELNIGDRLRLGNIEFILASSDKLWQDLSHSATTH